MTGPRGPSSPSKGSLRPCEPEAAPLGIHVVELGSFRASFLTSDSRREAAESIPVYTDTVGKFTEAIEASNGRQPGEPMKAAAAIRQLAAVDQPPVRLHLGRDCVSLVEDKLDTVAGELDRWRKLALSTDFPSS